MIPPAPHFWPAYSSYYALPGTAAAGSEINGFLIIAYARERPLGVFARARRAAPPPPLLLAAPLLVMLYVIIL